jgi:hypothetical protein
MTEQTIYIKTPVNKDDLEALITGLEAACGGNRIEIKETFDLIVTDQRQAAALKALFSEERHEKYIPKNKAQKKARSAPFDQKKAPGAYSYVIEGTGEVISAQMLHKRLAAKDILEFTVVTKKDKRFIVTADEQGVFSLAKEPRSTPREVPAPSAGVQA